MPQSCGTPVLCRSQGRRGGPRARVFSPDPSQLHWYIQSTKWRLALQHHPRRCHTHAKIHTILSFCGMLISGAIPQWCHRAGETWAEGAQDDWGVFGSISRAGSVSFPVFQRAEESFHSRTVSYPHHTLTQATYSCASFCCWPIMPLPWLFWLK